MGLMIWLMRNRDGNMVHSHRRELLSEDECGNDFILYEDVVSVVREYRLP